MNLVHSQNNAATRRPQKSTQRLIFVSILAGILLVSGAMYYAIFRDSLAFRNKAAHEIITEGSRAYMAGDCRLAVSRFAYLLSERHIDDDQRSSVLINKGYCEWQLGRNNEALRSFGLAAELDPINVQIEVYMAAMKRGETPVVTTFVASGAPSSAPDPVEQIAPRMTITFPLVDARVPAAKEDLPSALGVFVPEHAKVSVVEAINYTDGRHGFYARYSVLMPYGAAHTMLLQKSSVGWSLRVGHQAHGITLIERENPDWQARLVLTAADSYVTSVELHTIAR